MLFDTLDRNSLSEPLYLGLSAVIEDAIRSGALAPGHRLPPHRAVAAQLGLSIHTVSKAYERLRHLHLIDGQVGRGSYVIDPEAVCRTPYEVRARREGIFDLAISRPVTGALHERLMRAALNDVAAHAPAGDFLSSRPNLGQPHHRQAGVDWLSSCGLETTAERVITTNGATQGLTAALSALTRPGDTVLVESVTHHLVLSQCAYLGLTAIGLECDGHGVMPDSLERACAQLNPKALLLLPGLCNPRATVMPEARRREIAGIAVRHDLALIENDAFGPVMEDRPPPLATLAPEHTIHVTTFTKCTMPGLRAGYLVAAERFQPALLARIIGFSWNATPLVCEIATMWVNDGTAARLSAWQRAALAERFGVVREEMAGLDWQGHPAGLHFWLHLPETWSPEMLVRQARLLNVSIAPSGPFITQQAGPENAVRVSLGGVGTTAELRSALNLLSGLLKTRTDPALAADF